jgi:hypothetical protein
VVAVYRAELLRSVMNTVSQSIKNRVMTQPANDFQRLRRFQLLAQPLVILDVLRLALLYRHNSPPQPDKPESVTPTCRPNENQHRGALLRQSLCGFMADHSAIE